MQNLLIDGITYSTTSGCGLVRANGYPFNKKTKIFPSAEEMKNQIKKTRRRKVSIQLTNVLLRFLFKPIDDKSPKWQVETTAEALMNQKDDYSGFWQGNYSSLLSDWHLQCHKPHRTFLKLSPSLQFISDQPSFPPPILLILKTNYPK